MRETLVDTFMYSEAHELGVLLAKLNAESEIMSHWVIGENAYTIKGEDKGHHLQDLMKADNRFEAFLDRITVLEFRRDFAKEYRRTPKENLSFMARKAVRSRGVRHHMERPLDFAEHAQRNMALETVRSHIGKDGFVLISDVDEMIDASSARRRDLLMRGIRTGAKVLHLPRRRFVYDFDNVSLGRFRHIPLVHASALRSVNPFGVRVLNIGIVPTLEPLVFEYSYCYSREAMNRKLETFADLDPGESVLDRALECNHALIDTSASRLRNEDLFLKVDPEEAQHPSYILENLDTLCTGTVNPDYDEARRNRYPDLFRKLTV